ncbi:AraC family transcriptional regulator [Nonomuraea sp. NPDC050394]|uniref:AraC family transcriptional regulator n=1 Tax=Nonomuraea sp. NPDC050394 TaxID=3364363 RepID=UPI0037A99675
MDPLDDLLRGVRGQGAVFDASVLSPLSTARIGTGAPLTLCCPLRGEGRLVRGDQTHRVRAGEAAVVTGPEPFEFAGDTGPDHRTVLLTGSYEIGGEVARRLLRVLPPVLVVSDEHGCATMAEYLEFQLMSGRPGHQLVLDRLLDWLLVCTLREWFARPEAVVPGWYAALGDDVAGPALRAIHGSPAEPWTLATLAEAASVSRTTLAKRFTELVGEPPLAYLTGWRMALAADMLTEPAATVASVARKVGYADAFGFSTAFKRVLGKSPTAHRTAATG